MRISQYEDRTDRRYTKLQARWLFFDAISRVAPQVPSELSESVLPVFSALYRLVETNMKVAAYRKDAVARYGTARIVESHTYLCEWSKIVAASGQLYPDLMELRTAIKKWGVKYKIIEPWCYQIALKTLELWHRNETACDNHLWYVGTTGRGRPIALRECGFAFRTSDRRDSGKRGYNPFEETRSRARQRLTQAFAAELGRYLDGMDRLAESRGGKPATAKRQIDHFDWLARFQVAGEDPWKLQSI